MDEQLIRSITKKVLNEMSSSAEAGDIPIGISARHVHLCRKDLDILFGAGYELTFHKELMGGQYAAAETVTLAGRNSSALKARVLGPLRAATQAEISATDSRALGISAPLRDSGDIKGSEAITLIGPNGSVYLNEGCITAKRHIHMPPADASRFCVNDKDIVAVEIEGPRGGVFKEVLVRVDSSFTLEMHIDTDEANALGMTPTTRTKII